VAGIWQPIPIAVDIEGEVISVQLAYGSVLVSGLPGEGKSGLLNMFAAVGALDAERVDLHLFDSKEGVELSAWAGSATTFIGADPAAAASALEGIVSRGRARLQELRADGHRKVRPGQRVDLVVVDECDALLNTGNKALDVRCFNALREIVTRFRAISTVLVLAVARPSSDVMSTSIRDLAKIRIAFRCATAQSSDLVLGAGMAASGYSAADIHPGRPGQCWIYASGVPQMARTYWLDDEQVARLADVAVNRRTRGAVAPFNQTDSVNGDHRE